MIRIAEFHDLERIVEIYNQAIDARFQTGFMERISVPDRVDWFHQHTPSAFPLFVYESEGSVIGWVSVSPYRSGRAALKYTVEISYFVDNRHLKKGVGTQLLQHALNACLLLHYKAALAIVIDKNAASVALLEKFGFEQWGRLPGVVDFDGVVCGHLYYGKSLLPL